MIGSTSDSRNSLAKIFIFFIVLEIVLLVLFGIIKNDIGVSIVGSILSGSIVGLLVTYSQAKISASIYEESRIKAQHLEDIKRFLKDKDADYLAKIMIDKDEHKKEFASLEDIFIHWPEFLNKIRELSEMKLNLQRIRDAKEENKLYLNAHAKEIIVRINLEIKKRNRMQNFIPEFFNTDQDFSYINLSDETPNIIIGAELVASFKGFINGLINTFQHEISGGEKANFTFQRKLSATLSEDEKQFQRGIDSGANSYTSVISLFWKTWSDYIGGLANKPLHYAAYEARITRIYDLKSVPEKFTFAVKESIQSTLAKEEKIIDIVKLMEQEEEFKSKEIGLKTEAEKIKITIENSYFLKGDCSRIKE